MTKNEFLTICTRFLHIDKPVLDTSDFELDAAVMMLTRDGADGIGEFYNVQNKLPIDYTQYFENIASRFIHENKKERHVVFKLINGRITVDWQAGPIETINPQFIRSVRRDVKASVTA